MLAFRMERRERSTSYAGALGIETWRRIACRAAPR
jgi:hypothetical protein